MLMWPSLWLFARLCFVQVDAAAMEQHLAVVVSGLQEMQQLLSRMSERCDPYIYYRRVRVPMSGWKNNPALPQVRPDRQLLTGVVVNGCDDPAAGDCGALQGAAAQA